MSLQSKLARYIVALEASSASTHRAEDRAIYEKYLVDAAGILASCILAEPKSLIASRIAAHQRLWGMTWLQDEVYRKASLSWADVTKEAESAA